MNLLPNGSYVLSTVYLINGIIFFAMAFYFTKIHGNGLKSILYHLFFSFAGQYLFIGLLTFISLVINKEILDSNSIKLIASVFGISQLLALFRLYFYINKK